MFGSPRIACDTRMQTKYRADHRIVPDKAPMYMERSMLGLHIFDHLQHSVGAILNGVSR